MNLDFVMDRVKPETFARLSVGSLFGGTFISPESGNRGEGGVMASLTYIPEVADEEARVSAHDPLRGFVPVGELDDRSDEFGLDYVIEEDGEMNIGSIDMLAGPRANPMPKGMSLDAAVEKLMRFSPVYAVKMYEMAIPHLRFDVLVLLLDLTEKLVREGVYTPQAFQQTRIGGFTAYRVLKGYAADEKRASVPGVACRIIELLNGWAAGTA